jgi:hypothetical protein
VRRGQQLVPEWAAELSATDVACFVDASLAADDVELEILSTDEGAAAMDSHDLAPAVSASYMVSFFAVLPRVRVAIPPPNLDFGKALSLAATRGVS